MSEKLKSLLEISERGRAKIIKLANNLRRKLDVAESELAEARRELDEERARKVWCLEESAYTCNDSLGEYLVHGEKGEIEIIIDDDINAAIDRARGEGDE